MVGNPTVPQLTPTIRAALDALRRRIRRYVWLEGLAVAMIWLGAAFWIGLAVDWFFEPPGIVRAVFLGAIALALAAILYWLVVRRAFARLSDRNMAMLLERTYPQFRESLLTAVELTERPLAAGECNPILLERTCRIAAEAIPGLQLAEVFDPAPLRRSVAGAALLMVSILFFAFAYPTAFHIWTQRNLLMSERLWPRRTRLVLEGFDHGMVKVARGADLEVIAKADLSKPLVPQTVEIRYRTDEGVRGRVTMSREGMVDRSHDQFQEYAHTFRGVLTPLSFDVVGGDDALRDLRVEVVDSPTIVSMELDCRFPAYTARPANTRTVSGPMQVPAGTHVTIRARTNKDLVQASIQSALDDPPKPAEVIQFAGQSNRRAFSWDLGALGKDQTLLFTLLDADGIRSGEPVRLNLACVADEPPKLALRLAGIGPAITPAARLPATGHITDDYGVAKTWFEYAVDQQASEVRPIAAPPGNPTDLAVNDAFEAADLKLAAGQKLTLAVQAADRCDLLEKPNVGTSEHWVLDVVTPEQLRVMLEARELVLRQRFETIVDDMTETRDSLVRVDSDSSTGPPSPTEAGVKPEGSEPGDRKAPAEASPERALGVHALRVQRALQNSRKDSHEVLGVAEGFDDIRLELVNNRIDTVELRIRLEQGISQPLRKIADEMFPELERRLGQLEADLADPKLGPKSRDAARKQCDAILLAMRQVLGRMLEQEDFNEAVELLRGIITSQEKLNDDTRKQHKGTLRDLLEK